MKKPTCECVQNKADTIIDKGTFAIPYRSGPEVETCYIAVKDEEGTTLYDDSVYLLLNFCPQCGAPYKEE